MTELDHSICCGSFIEVLDDSSHLLISRSFFQVCSLGLGYHTENCCNTNVEGLDLLHLS